MPTVPPVPLPWRTVRVPSAESTSFGRRASLRDVRAAAVEDADQGAVADAVGPRAEQARRRIRLSPGEKAQRRRRRPLLAGPTVSPLVG